MSPKLRLRQRMRVVLHMVMAFVVMILLAQLWLFTVTIEAMETRSSSPQVVIAALVCSFIGCVAVWTLMGFFLRTYKEDS
jgi:formate/nitrite transporter FocA (FNT family)